MKKKKNKLYSASISNCLPWLILFPFPPSLPGDDDGDDDDAVFVDMCQRFWTCLLLLMEESPGSGIKHLEA